MDFDKITIDAVSCNVKDSTARQQISELNSRISTIIADGQQTEGNTELIDIRTGEDGKVYPTAGDAVRGQIGANKEAVSELKEDLKNQTKTITIGSDSINWTDGKFINYEYGISMDNSGTSISDFIDVSGYKYIKIVHNSNLNLSNISGLAFYANNVEQGAFIYGHQYNVGESSFTYTVNRGDVKYLRLTVPTSKKSNAYVEKSIDILESAKSYTDSFHKYDYTRIFHKLGGIGDSLMSGSIVTDDWQYFDKYEYSWLSFIANENNCEKVHYSNAGLTAKQWIEDVNYWKSKVNEESIKPNAYYIGLGTNDIVADYSIGSIDDEKNTDSFVGYYKSIIEYVHEKAPNAVIFCVSTYANSEKNIQYSNMIEQISNLYDYCFYVDFIGKSDFVLSNTNSYICNNSHFTTLGYAMVAKKIKQITNDIIYDNLYYFKMFGLNQVN